MPGRYRGAMPPDPSSDATVAPEPAPGAPPGTDPELARLQEKMDAAHADRLLRSPWHELRLAWTAMLAAGAGGLLGLLATRGAARARGLPEQLVGQLGLRLHRFPEPLLEVLQRAGLGLCLFGLPVAALLLLRVGRRAQGTRHEPTARAHARVAAALGLLLLGTLGLLWP